MRRLHIIVLLGLALPCLAHGQATRPETASSQSAQMQNSPKPGSEHKKLEIWVGDWT